MKNKYKLNCYFKIIGTTSLIIILDILITLTIVLTVLNPRHLSPKIDSYINQYEN